MTEDKDQATGQMTTNITPTDTNEHDLLPQKGWMARLRAFSIQIKIISWLWLAFAFTSLFTCAYMFRYEVIGLTEYPLSFTPVFDRWKHTMCITKIGQGFACESESAFWLLRTPNP
jgi:hypothetical protein